MRKLLGAVALVGMLAMPGLVQAQTVVGGAVAYHDDLEAFGVGGYVGIPLSQIHESLALNPNFIFFFPDGGDYWELNGDLIWRFPVSGDSPVLPFALGGIAIAHVSPDVGNSDTDIGINLGGGVIFPLETVRPAVGAKFEIQNNTSFVIFGGIGFPIG